MLQRKDVTNDLNLGWSERARALLALATIGSLAAWALAWVPGWIPASLAAVMLAANASFLSFFTRTKGALFALRALMFHQVYYLYSSAAFAIAFVTHYLGRRNV